MVLYINGNYPHHSLHGELVSKLADLGNIITVFIPVNGTDLFGKYDVERPEVRIVYCDVLKRLDRLFFISKIHRIVKAVENEVDMSKVECILAGTVYSDGAVAYLLHKKYHIPFSVAVRETDVTYQMKWRPYLNGFVKNLLHEASKVLFLSPAYQEYLEKFNCNHEKYVIVPNAVNDYWFQNSSCDRKLHDPVSLIYVGEISKRKNVETTISAVAELKKRGVSAEFHVVGSGGEEDNCKALAENLGVINHIHFHGWQTGMDKIKSFYDQSDIFVMPSYKETFGTVYIEAMTQGLPVIYTKGQGIDGYFEQGSVGYACEANNVNDIADAIVNIVTRFNEFSKRSVDCSDLFQWRKVADSYNDIFCSMRKNEK